MGSSVVRLPMLKEYLAEQRSLSAVERFSQHHDGDELPAQQRYYRDLIPMTAPEAGQHFGFQVDLDACTGCKACVTACHSLNGLDDGEIWRHVGLLHGGTEEQPIQQTVTTACHHCLDPACMTGCPVMAYEKDPVTGIVRHLDDQCIGCQYCTLTCPYEVPQFHAKKGIVRKCDMCSHRLEVGEAPACVQSCPNEAISIRIVDREAVLEAAEADVFLPGAPSPGITAPTTEYKTARALPRNLLPADYYDVRPAHQHAPLVVMLVLTQLSVGAFWVHLVLARAGGVGLSGSSRTTQFHALVALALGLLALGASVFHLGRPMYAFRAFLGIRTSWLSREIIAFGAFAKLAVVYAGVLWQGPVLRLLGMTPLSPSMERSLVNVLGPAVAGAGLLGVFASVMVYAVTQKAFWDASRAGVKFFGTAMVLGMATTLATTAAVSAFLGINSLASEQAVLCLAIVVAVTLKLAFETAVLSHLNDKTRSELKRSALLLVGALRRLTVARALTASLGGVVLPMVARAEILGPARPGVVVAASVTGLVLLVAGELLERALFFTAVSSPAMPGSVG